MSQDLRAQSEEIVSKTQILVICEKAIFSDMQKWSLIDIFDAIVFDKMPAIFTFSFFSAIISSLGNHKIDINITTPDSEIKTLFTTPIVILEGGKHTLNLRLSIGFEKIGRYIFSLLIDDNKLGEAFLDVSMKESALISEGSNDVR
jgi:hypothetical protein